MILLAARLAILVFSAIGFITVIEWMCKKWGNKIGFGVTAGILLLTIMGFFFKV